MHAFKDSKDKAWEVVIDPFTIEKVRGRLGVNLYDLNKSLEELLSDPPKFVNAIFLLCADQAEREGASERQFCRDLDGDSIERAREAFEKEIIFFSPKAAKESLQKAMGLQKELTLRTVAKLQERARDKLAVIDGKFLDNLAEKTATEIERKALAESA